jgi:hypothetical protein
LILRGAPTPLIEPRQLNLQGVIQAVRRETPPASAVNHHRAVEFSP